MKIILTGGTGFIGSHLVTKLISDGHNIALIGRKFEKRVAGVTYYTTDFIKGDIDPTWFRDVDAVVHLAGAPIIGHRWTAAYRRQIFQSRVTVAEKMIGAIQQLPRDQQPQVIISASAIGYYGDRAEEVLTEQSNPGDDFLADICQKWEEVWRPIKDAGARVVFIRTGIVLDQSGGMIKVLKYPARFGLNAVLGNGQQWVSWISVRDIVSIYVLAMSDPTLRGPINAVAPNPIRHKEMMRQISVYYHRPLFLSVPSIVPRIIIGEAASLVLSSQHVLPTKLTQNNFSYHDETISSALRTDVKD